MAIQIPNTHLYTALFFNQALSYHAHLIFIALNSRSHMKELSGNMKDLYLYLGFI